MNWAGMAVGCNIPVMEKYGSTTNLASDPITAMEIGTILNMAGNGFQTTIGDGRLSIMGVGNWIPIMAGYGYRDMNGRLPGFRGVSMVIIMDGPHLALAYPSISILDPFPTTDGHSVHDPILTTGDSGTIVSPSHKTGISTTM